MTELQFAQLAGKSMDSPEVRRYIDSLGSEPTISEFEGGRIYCSLKQIGLELVFDEDELRAIHYLGPDSDSDAAAYAGALPGGLTFNDSKDAVLKKLGAPAKSQQGVDDPRPFVEMKPWVKYRFGDHWLQIQFLQGANRIRVVTLDAAN